MPTIILPEQLWVFTSLAVWSLQWCVHDGPKRIKEEPLLEGTGGSKVIVSAC